MKVVLAGGTGFIGRNLHKALAKRGHTVTLISRNPGKACVTWQEVERERSLPECEALVNLCGEYILSSFRRWNPSYKRDIFDSRIGTNRKLVSLMTQGSVTPNVWVSLHAEGYYPRSDTCTFDEDFVLEKPDSYVSKLCTDWEESARLPPSEKIRHVGVRTGVVLGPDGGLIQQTYWPFWFGLGGVIGSGNQQFPWIHISDMVNLILYSIENGNVHGILNGVSPGSCTSAEFTKAYGSAIQRPTIFSVPSFFIKFGVGDDRAPLMLEGAHIVPKRTLDTGFKFEFENIYDAMKDIIK